MLVLSLCFAKVGALALSNEALNLVQKKVEAFHNSDINLPGVSQVMKGSEEAFEQVTGGVNNLESNLQEIQSSGTNEVKKLKDTFEKQLKEQNGQIEKTKKQNDKLSADIKEVHTSIVNHRSLAFQLQTDCSKLQDHIKNLEVNISTAEEFAKQAMARASNMLEGSNALAVLDELDALDSDARKKAAHAATLDKIAHGQNKMQLFQQYASTASRKPQNAQELLASLTASIDELKQQQATSAKSLKAAFNKAFEEGNATLQAAIEEQAQLKEILEDKTLLQGKIMKAEAELERKKAKLQHDAQALKVFAQRLGAQPSVSLLQVSSNDVKKGSGASLPKVSSFMKQPTHVFEKLHGSLSELQESLAEVQNKQRTQVAKMKSKYQKEMDAGSAENLKIEKINKNLKIKIQKTKDVNKGLRQHAKSLEKETDKMQAAMELLQSNITTAQEFTEKVLASSDNALHNATELSVLLELDDKDAAEHSAKTHKKSLSDIGDDEEESSLLQVGAEAAKKDAAAELLASLMSSLDDLNETQEESEASLKETFDEEMNATTKKHDELVEEHAELNETLVNEIDLEHKLKAAVTHLKETRDALQDRTFALHKFADRVSQEDVAVSLMQIEAHKTEADKADQADKVDKKKLPDVAKVMNRPTEMFKQIGSNVGQLESKLGEIQKMNDEAMNTQRAEYDNKLKALAKANKIVAVANHMVASDIKNLRTTNEGIRAEAKTYMEKNEDLKLVLKLLQKNMTTAQEFTAGALESADQKLYNASEVQVLMELDEQDRNTKDQTIHMLRLQEVAEHQTMGMLQIPGSVDKDPQSLVENLLGSLNQLAQEQGESAQTLKAAYETEFAASEKKHEALAAEQEKLAQTKAAEETLNARLTKALKHLKGTCHSLSAQVDGIRTFMQKMSEISTPSNEAEAARMKSSMKKPGMKNHAKTQQGLNHTQQTEAQDVKEEAEVAEVAQKPKLAALAEKTRSWLR